MGPLSRAGELGALPRLWLGWEVAGGETWDVQSDGQLLRLVQAVARARQVGWCAGPLPRGMGTTAPLGRAGVASSLGEGGVGPVWGMPLFRMDHSWTDSLDCSPLSAGQSLDPQRIHIF